MAKKICPECGRDLTGLSPAKHAFEHWDPKVVKDARISSDVARKRYDALIAMEGGE